MSILFCSTKESDSKVEQMSVQKVNEILENNAKETIEKLKSKENSIEISTDLLTIGELVTDVAKKVVGPRHVFLNSHPMVKDDDAKEAARIQTILTDLLKLKSVYEIFTKESVGFVNFHYLDEAEDPSDYLLVSALEQHSEVLPIQTFFYKVEKGKRSLVIDYQFLPDNLILLYGDFMTKGLFLDILKALENVGKNVLCFYKTFAS